MIKNQWDEGMGLVSQVIVPASANRSMNRSLLHNTSTAAFGSSNSERFPSQIWERHNESIGPGTYNPQAFSTIKDQSIIKPSFSKLGYGNGFISSNERFKEEDIITPFWNLGPGKYESQSSFQVKKLNRKAIGFNSTTTQHNSALSVNSSN